MRAPASPEVAAARLELVVEAVLATSLLLLGNELLGLVSAREYPGAVTLVGAGTVGVVGVGTVIGCYRRLAFLRVEAAISGVSSGRESVLVDPEEFDAEALPELIWLRREPTICVSANSVEDKNRIVKRVLVGLLDFKRGRESLVREAAVRNGVVVGVPLYLRCSASALGGDLVEHGIRQQVRSPRLSWAVRAAARFGILRYLLVVDLEDGEKSETVPALTSSSLPIQRLVVLRVGGGEAETSSDVKELLVIGGAFANRLASLEAQVREILGFLPSEGDARHGGRVHLAPLRRLCWSTCVQEGSGGGSVPVAQLEEDVQKLVEPLSAQGWVSLEGPFQLEVVIWSQEHRDVCGYLAAIHFLLQQDPAYDERFFAMGTEDLGGEYFRSLAIVIANGMNKCLDEREEVARRPLEDVLVNLFRGDTRSLGSLQTDLSEPEMRQLTRADLVRWICLRCEAGSLDSGLLRYFHRTSDLREIGMAVESCRSQETLSAILEVALDKAVFLDLWTSSLSVPPALLGIRGFESAPFVVVQFLSAGLVMRQSPVFPADLVDKTEVLLRGQVDSIADSLSKIFCARNPAMDLVGNERLYGRSDSGCARVLKVRDAIAQALADRDSVG